MQQPDYLAIVDAALRSEQDRDQGPPAEERVRAWFPQAGGPDFRVEEDEAGVFGEGPTSSFWIPRDRLEAVPTPRAKPAGVAGDSFESFKEVKGDTVADLEKAWAATGGEWRFQEVRIPSQRRPGHVEVWIVGTRTRPTWAQTCWHVRHEEAQKEDG